MDEARGKAATNSEDKSKKDLSKIRALSFFAAGQHMIAAAGMTVMAFTRSSIDQEFSLTIVLCAFSAMITCIWAGVGCYETWAGSMQVELPMWEWHNRHFVTAVGVVMALTFFLWPSVVIFILQAIGFSFWALLPDLEADAKGQIIFHIFALVVTSGANLLSLIITTQLLSRFQSTEVREEKEVDDDDVEEDDEDDVEGPPTVSLGVLVMAGLKAFADVVYTIDLLILAARKANSGTMGAAIVQIAATVVFLVFSIKLLLRRNEIDLDDWLMNWRALTICHLFVAYVCFWVTVAITLLALAQGADFWVVVGNLSNLQTFMVTLQIAIFFVYVVNYAALLLLHNRCMSSLDEIAALRLIEIDDRQFAIHHEAEAVLEIDDDTESDHGGHYAAYTREEEEAASQ